MTRPVEACLSVSDDGSGCVSVEAEHEQGDREVDEQLGAVYEGRDERRRDNGRVDPEMVEDQG